MKGKPLENNSDLTGSIGFLSFPLNFWYFLISKKYRESVYEKWKEQSQIKILRDVTGLIAGFVVSVAILILLISYFISNKT
ncbi:MAG: hypothetical protein GY749_47375 [Desulfobacteraceae bacterium]|nr:hypothetical protein [Desulfobacteraceae bacterium]